MEKKMDIITKLHEMGDPFNQYYLIILIILKLSFSLNPFVIFSLKELNLKIQIITINHLIRILYICNA